MSREVSRHENSVGKDAEYARQFWERGQPEGMREAMIRNIVDAATTGTKGIFAGSAGFDERDKQKMSAYRELAREMGYEIGPFQLDRPTGVASAAIRKLPEQRPSPTSTKLPGEPMKTWRQFLETVREVDGEPKVVGFHAPDGKYYALGKNEQLVHIQTGDGTDRNTFIRQNGQDIPFETWKQNK